MKTTVNVLCYKSKTLKNGEHPLMVCVCKNRKRRYISLACLKQLDVEDVGFADEFCNVFFM